MSESPRILETVEKRWRQGTPRLLGNQRGQHLGNRQLLAGLLLALGFVVTGCSTVDNTSPQTPPASEEENDTASSSASPTENTEPNTASGAPETKPDSADLQSLSVVDGDTVKLPNGQSVRVVGIDTPERGECGFSEATALTAATIAQGAALKKIPGHENTDRYDRLLRYVVNASGTDLGTRLLKAGLATARYDSRDGYDAHPNENKYHKIDSSTPHQCGTTGAAPSLQNNGASSNNATECDPNYGGICVPMSDTDLDCSDLSGPVTIKGLDPHGFDGNGDGLGCQ